MDLAQNDWQQIEVPLRGVESLVVLSLRGERVGGFHLDDIALVAPEPPTMVTAIVEPGSTEVPPAFELLPNYPNPFNATTVIPFSLPRSEIVQLAVYNLAGQRLLDLMAGRRPAGIHQVTWDGRDGGGRDLASGTYVLLLRAGGRERSRKVLLLR